MRKVKLFFTMLMLMAFSVGNVWGATYKLTQVTSVSAGNKYVFVQSGHAMNATVTSSALQTTTSYNTTGLAGTEVYVWTLETATGGFYMKNVSLNSNQYLNNASSTNISFGSKSSIWTFTFTDGVALIQNKNNSNRFLGFTSATSYAYKAYATSNLSSYSHAITVYVLEEESTGCEKKVNISAGTTSNGTFDLSKTGEAATCDAAVEVTVTPHPAEHFEVDEVTASNGGSVSGPDGDGKYTVTYAQDYNNSSEINVTFKQKTQYTVTWNNNGDESVTTQVYEGEKPTFPSTPVSCDGSSTTFIGWSNAVWTGKIENLNEKTVYTSAAEMPAVGAAVTYYAVFAKVAGESGWIETAITDLGASDVFVFSDGSYALNNDATSAAPTANAITVSAGKITSAVADKLKWNISGNATDGYTFYPNGSTTTWLYCNTTAGSSSNNNMRVGTGDRKVFEINASGYLVTKDTYTARYLSIYNNADFRGYTNTDNNPILPKFYKYTAGSASDYMTTCCTKYNVAIADNIEHGSISADLASACEGTEITLTPSAAGGYHFDAWDVYKTGESATKITVTANKFDMPAYDVTVSASFEHDPCTNLSAPTLNGDIAVTYNSATINWNSVAHAVSYDVVIVRHSDSEPIFSGNVTATDKALTGLDPETQYDYSIMGVGDGSDYCTSGNNTLEGNFTTSALPEAVLTLMENGNEVAGGSHAITVPFALPTEVTHTCGKTFVGWTSKSDFADGDESLASYYEKGADFTFENTDAVTLYAVYADGGATEETATVSIASYATTNSWGNGTQHSSVTLDENVTATASSGTNTGKYYTTGNEWRFYQGESATITIATAVGELSSIKFTYSVANTGILEDGEDNVVESATAVSASGTSAVYHVANSGTATNGQVKFTAIEVKYLKPGSYSNYSITCAQAPEVAVDPEEVNAPAAGVAAGVIEALYDNVNEGAISVALFNDAACTEAFDGGWLTASINGEKNIAYTVAESNVYVARTAYIKLTAPETTGATAPAVVIIPVSQEGKATVFSSLEDMVAANLESGTEVTVSFSNILITEVYETNVGYRYGLYLNVKDKDGENDIELFYNKQGNSEQVPNSWVKNGYVSATNLVTTWTEYKGQWELAMQGATWSWENGDITYAAPKAVSSVEVSGEPTKTVYVDGEKFNPAGLTVTVNYTVGDPEEIDATDADWVYETSDVMALNQTSINVKATYNTVTSENFYEVTGLTVGEIPNKTVAEFIAAGNADMRCYLEGIVSDIETGSKLKYGNFNLTDASGTIYVYGCLNQAGEAQKFDELGVQNGDKIKVIAEDYDYYNSKHEAKNVQFVSKVSKVQITIADKTLEVGQNWTIEATTDPAAAIDHISYSIKNDGSDTYVSLADNEITANAVGTATIIASIPAGEGYLANEIEFEVEVVEAGSIANVVILAKYDGQWYALMNEVGSVNNSLNALAVDYNEEEGVLLDVAQPSAITWTRSIAAGKATFLNGTKYIAGGSANTNLTLSESASEWTIDESGHYMKGGRTFLYNDGGYFKNYNAGTNAGAAHYSDYPVVLANPQFVTRDVLRGELTEGKWGTYCPSKDVKYPAGASFYTLTYKEEVAGQPYKVFFDEVEPGAALVGGKPYLFIAEGEAIKGVKVGDAASLQNYNGFTGVLSDYILNVTASESAAYKYYIIYGNEIRLCGAGMFNVPAERAYLDMSQMSSTPVAQAPGRRRISLVNHAAETATGIENAETNEAPCKVLINGELFIIRGEKMYDAKGQLVK